MKTLSTDTPTCLGCPGAQLAALLPPEQRRRKGSYASLIALLIPGVAFGLGLLLLGRQESFYWLKMPGQYPWELWLIALCGSVATLAGIGDWAFHRWMAKCAISKKERDCELLALAGGGLPMFILMSCASISPAPSRFLLPVILVLLFTTTLICYDEFIFHRRRCTRWETLLHRGLVFGNGIAWLAWAHWCFVRGGNHD